MARKAGGSTGTGSRPTGEIRVTMYDVGFGDCFLLSFGYGDGGYRHVLIDCGSSTERKDHMAEVVSQIAKDCQGRLHGLVVTHRHSDHLSAFGLTDVGKALEALRPDIVVQPWTEHPDAKTKASEAPSVFTGTALAHLDNLAAAQSFAQQFTADSARLLRGVGMAMRQQVTFIAGLSIPNKAAVERLQGMGKRHAYVYYGSHSGLDRVLPGVKVTVLGPPTLKQSEQIRHQTQSDPSEFWKLRARLAAAAAEQHPQARGASVLFPRAHTSSIAASPSYVKWAINKLDRASVENMSRIVREMDDALNNTSVVLLFEVGGKMLLFPGDAQLENWQYALHEKATAKRLQATNLYKVGHHGSTNATPKKLLWEAFRNRGPKGKRGRLVALLSTKPGKHHDVPRQSLVTALGDETDLHSTQDWGKHRQLSETYIL